MDDDIKKLRKQIDDIDTRIVELLAERFKLALPIARVKREHGIGIHDGDREYEVISRLDNYGAACGVPPGLVPCIYELIFDFMRDYQRRKNIIGD